MYDQGPQTFPALKGKGAEIRNLCGPLLKAFEKLMDPAKKEERWMRLVLSMATQAETILDTHAGDYKLPAEAADEYKRCTEAFFQLNTSLGRFFHGGGIMLFNFVIKMHYGLHIGLIAQHINPRLGWCYAGEDFMQRVKSISQASSAGSPPHLIVDKIMKKYAQGLAMTFLDRPFKR